MSIFDDDMMISSYIHNTNNRISNDTSNQVDSAIKWTEDTNCMIIVNTTDLIDLENQWILFNSMTRDERRRADWKSIELFGRTNQQTYEMYRAELLKQDIDNEIDQDFDSLLYDASTPLTESYLDEDNEELNYTSEDVEKAIKWAEESDRTIIIPTRTLNDLESLWDNYASMHHKHCRESDWKSLELFGVTNLKHYEYLKNQFLRNDINKSDMYKYASIAQFLESSRVDKYCTKLAHEFNYNECMKNIISRFIPTRTIYEDAVIGNAITGINNTIGDMIEVIEDPNISYGDLPYFTPDDMITSGIFSDVPAENYYGEIADNSMINDTISVKEWFNMYRASYDGFYTEFSLLNSDWVSKVRELTEGLKLLKSTKDESAINRRKQSILELGWNPDVEFSDKNRIIAKECINNIMSNNNQVSRVIDLCGFKTSENRNNAINEVSRVDSHGEPIYPIYVVLIEGKTFVSPIIKKATNSTYSHSAISLDSSMTRMYSFGMQDSNNKMSHGGGFRVENINDIRDDRNIGVYTIFVHEKEYDLIKSSIKYLEDNITKTKYDYSSLIHYIFNVPCTTKSMSMICSQFVDRCFKIAGIDVTHKDSSLVSPEDLNKCCNSNKTIYKIYNGTSEKYNTNRTNSIVDSLYGKAVPIKESYTDEKKYLLDIVNNIYDISALREMRSSVSIVKNEDIRNFLERNLFEYIDLVPYENTTISTNKLSMDFVNESISKYIPMYN